jgi:D-alanyl-D-alanine carboxypeptidase
VTDVGPVMDAMLPLQPCVVVPTRRRATHVRHLEVIPTESLQAVLARVHEIRALVAPPATGVVTQMNQPSTSAPSRDFAAALAAAGQHTAASSPAQSLAPPARLPGAPSTGGPTTVSGIKSAWQNGRVPEAQLVPLGQGGQRLAAPAAAAFTGMEAAARASGVSLRVTDSYRSYDQQVDVARRKGLYSDGGLAATPGSSQHGWGLAVDLDLDQRAQDWMRANGARFGFVEDVPREPWHWTFHGARP